MIRRSLLSWPAGCCLIVFCLSLMALMVFNLSCDSDNDDMSIDGVSTERNPTGAETLQARRLNPQATICIVMSDSRFTDQEIQFASASSISQLATMWDPDPVQHHNSNSSSRSVPMLSMTVAINKLYALRHGYSFFISDIASFKHKYPGFAPAWFKVHYVRDLMIRSQQQQQHHHQDLKSEEKKPECKWFMYMDSDAMFFMNEHRLSIEDWLATTSVSEYSSNFIERELFRQRPSSKDHIQGRVELWEETSHFIIGHNGINMDREGYSKNTDAFLSASAHLVCTGTWMVANDAKGLEMMERWANTSNQELLLAYAENHPWEQAIFNIDVLGHYYSDISIFPYSSFTMQSGPWVKHFWGKQENAIFEQYSVFTRQLFDG